MASDKIDDNIVYGSFSVVFGFDHSSKMVLVSFPLVTDKLTALSKHWQSTYGLIYPEKRAAHGRSHEREASGALNLPFKWQVRGVKRRPGLFARG